MPTDFKARASERKAGFFVTPCPSGTPYLRGFMSQRDSTTEPRVAPTKEALPWVNASAKTYLNEVADGMVPQVAEDRSNATPLA